MCNHPVFFTRDGDSDELIDTIVKVQKNGEKLEEIEMYYDFNPYTSMQSMEVRSKKMLLSDYESFKQKLVYDLKQQLTGTGVKVDIRTIPKINEVLDGITFQRTGDTASPILYVEEAYKHYQSGQAYGQVLNDAMDFACDEKNYETNLPKLTDDYVRRNLYLVLMNFQGNKELLLHMPYERIADLAVVPKVEIITSDPEEKVSFFMNYDMMDKYHLTAEETFRIAHENMEQKDYICQPLMGDMGVEEDPKIYVLTNDISVDGAAAIVSEKAMTEARKLIGEDFMILPSSRHEVILVPRSDPMSVKQMEDLVRDANRVVVAPKDKLSDHVYRYHSKDRSIMKVTALKEQQKLTLDPNIIH